MSAATAATLLVAGAARADLGTDLARLKQAFATQARSESLRVRLLERGDAMPVVLPPWALDAAQGECTTLALLAPPSTQFLVRVHPWQALPSNYSSQAGALQITRCGRDRLSFVQVLVEMRSPRAALYTLVAVGKHEPPALSTTLTERTTGPAAAPGDAGPLPAREPLAVRMRRFSEAASANGATSVDAARLPGQGYARFVLQPGCHRLLASGTDGAPPYTLLLADNDDSAPRRLEATESGDVREEVCTVRERRLLASVEAGPEEVERLLSVAHYPLPRNLPARFGPEMAERLSDALGGSQAPRQLGTLVSASLGAQGRTPLPRSLLSQTCYLAAAVVVHGGPQALSLGVRAGATNSEATTGPNLPGPRVSFCTGQSPQVELDVEARGLGLAWLFLLFQMGPARPGGE